MQKKTDYSTTPLAQKLGIKTDSVVLLLSAPPAFDRLLAPLPAGVRLVTETAEPVEVITWFVTDPSVLAYRIGELAKLVEKTGGLWVIWPKKSSNIPSDLTFEMVQEAGLGAGLVDNKSCSVDGDWQAVRFVYRKRDRK